MLPTLVLDPHRFTALGEKVEGRCVPDDLPALTEALFSSEGWVQYTLSGRVTDAGHRELEVSVSGQLWLTCQRCLQGMPYELAAHSRLRLVRKEEELPPLEEEAEDVETVVQPDTLVVAEWVAEEVLLALPLSPVHPDGDCDDEVEFQDEDPVKGNPFAVLKGLKN